MKFSATYTVTPRLQDDSVKQFFWHVLLRPQIGGLLSMVAVLLAFIGFDLPYRPWVIGFGSGVLLFACATWCRTYLQIIAQARSGLRLMENPQVVVTLDDSCIEYASSTGTRRHAWDKIERLIATKDFVILMHGKLPLLSLPKACLSSEALAFMQQKMSRQTDGFRPQATVA